MGCGASAGLIAAGVGAAASVGGALINSSSAGSAADTQAAAANRAADLQLQQYHETVANLSPFRTAGLGAVNILSSLYGIPSNPVQTSGGTSGGTSAGSGSTGTSGTGMGQNPLASVSGGDTSWAAAHPNAPPSASNGPLPEGTLPPGWQFIQGQQGGIPGPDGGYQSATPDYVVDQDGATVSPTQLALALAKMGRGQSSGGSGGPSVTQSLPSAIGGAPKSFSYNPEDFGLGNGVFNPTQAALEATPGYQFTRDQGLKSVQNSAAARGLGVSGAALKGAARFATGLADQTLNTQANIFGNNVSRTQGIFQSNLNNYLNPLMYLSNLGENAAATAGQQGVQAVGNAGQALIGGANAQAAGIVGGANAISSGLNGVAGAPMNYMLYNKLLGGGGAGGGGGGYVDSGSWDIA